MEEAVVALNPRSFSIKGGLYRSGNVGYKAALSSKENQEVMSQCSVTSLPRLWDTACLADLCQLV